MNPKILPTVLAVIDLGAAVVYLVHGDVRKFFYWLCAGVLTTVVTW